MQIPFKKKTRSVLLAALYLFGLSASSQAMLLVPMDDSQSDHLKAYGLAYRSIQKGIKSWWLLNYRGGSFIFEPSSYIEEQAILNNITVSQLSDGRLKALDQLFAGSNMARIRLEKAPKIAIYSPPDADPWDDAVTMAVEYAGISYEKIWDADVLAGGLSKYDWLHLHHEDFSGQFGKFWSFARNEKWYQERRLRYEKAARLAGFKRVADYKGAVAVKIQKFVSDGGFLFAMCSATDSLDIALAALGVDIIDNAVDGTPIDPDHQQKLDYNRTFAFENFKLVTDPSVYEFSDIDIDPRRENILREKDYFTLFEFSAHYDPVATILTQNHRRTVEGFLGQTTAFHRDRIKKRTVILGDSVGTNRVRYIHGTFGKGRFSFYGGHDPEDYQHFVGDPPTDLSLHKNSPGYRLILNNILFPAARKKIPKT